jgi:hypothetical protein
MRELWPPKVEGGQKLIKKPPNVTKANSQAPKKILVCCFVVIKVQK